MVSKYNLRSNIRSRANSLPVSPTPPKIADSSISLATSDESTQSAIGQDGQNIATPRRYSDVVRGDVAPPREVNSGSRTPSLLTSGSRTPSLLIPGLRSASPVEPDLKCSSSVVSSASRCSPMLCGYELEGTPSMPRGNGCRPSCIGNGWDGQ